MNDLRSLLADVAGEVAPADLAPRVTAGLRRRARRRKVAVAALSVAVLAVGAVGTSALTRRKPAGLTPATSGGGYDGMWIDIEDAGRTWRIQAQRVGEPRSDRGLVTAGMLTEFDLSPDGTAIAFTTPAGIAVARFDEKAELQEYPIRRAIGPTEARPAFSPDGRSVLYRRISRKTQGISYDGFAVVDLATGAVTDVAYPHGDGDVAWSPDGATVAVPSLGDQGIDLVTLAGARVGRIGGPGWFPLVHGWSPDGRHQLVAIVDDLGGGREAHGAAVVTLTGDVVLRLPLEEWVWRDAGHVAALVGDDDVEERGLDGSTRPLMTFDFGLTGVHRPTLRPAS
ncbi:MAG TPA: hypothetical protein VNQ77_01040 [Frankiaceae bacterium]|nr:hypothetical protein [Frankiaceae bacterium]